MSAVAVLLAMALLAGAGPPTARARAGLRSPGRQRGHRAARADPLAAASSLDVLALCLVSGMAVPEAATAAARSAPVQLGRVLRRGADLLTLGAEPAVAWSPPAESAGPVDTQIAALQRMARRSGSSGTALAAGVAELAGQCRHGAAHSARAAAERAGVLIAAPLALCFLPAFVCLGIIPVVAGLTGRLLESGLL